MDLDWLIDDFKEVARSGIEDSAEIVMPSCLGIAEPLAVSNVADIEDR